ncbi:hypothetical protein KAR91_52190 [Candidatus Pacearchaeota archaeon]|nr:hypothetical protein [Candidatus Pacearchaeota archaeon]
MTNLSKEQLLELFPDYKSTLYYGSMEDNCIIPVFTDWDRRELEERLVEEHNSNNMQGVLFL